MTVYVEISQLNHLVTIVMRGSVEAQEVQRVVDHLTDRNFARHSKIVEMAGADFDLSEDQYFQVEEAMSADDQVNPLAFVVGQDQACTALAFAFADFSSRERPVAVFRSIHEARAWLFDAERSSMESHDRLGHRRPTTASPLVPIGG
jgi:hypothetical protein